MSFPECVFYSFRHTSQVFPFLGTRPWGHVSCLKGSNQPISLSVCPDSVHALLFALWSGGLNHTTPTHRLLPNKATQTTLNATHILTLPWTKGQISGTFEEKISTKRILRKSNPDNFHSKVVMCHVPVCKLNSDRRNATVSLKGNESRQKRPGPQHTGEFAASYKTLNHTGR